MKMFVVFVILLHVSQHALALVVEVNEGEDYVLLPCQYSGIIPETNPTVTWTRNDLDLKSVHLRGEGGDDLTGQNQRYSRRTSMRSDALDTGDFSLSLRTPTKTDSSNYSCSISDGGEERRVIDIQLKVKDQQVTVKVVEGSQSAILPCKTTADLSQDATVEWTRSDVDFMLVHVYSKTRNTIREQDGFYRVRTMMNEDPLRTGDLSLTLKYPTDGDSGGYVCTIYRDKDILRQKVVLQVKERSWAKVLVALLVLLVLIVVSGGLLYHFRHYFMSGYKVVVDSGVESVKLPCKIRVHVPKDAKVEWTDNSISNRKVYVSDQVEEQDQVYRDRTEMKRKLLKPGDLSLTLKYPTDKDSNTYTCSVCIREGNQSSMKMKKEVELIVKVPQVEVVDSGVESVQLPCKATVNLPEDAKVEWTDSSHRKVHIWQNRPDNLEEQFEFYKNRTQMKNNPLTTGDLSLTLTYPTDWDGKTYTCTVYNGQGNTLMKKQVELKVRGKVELTDQQQFGNRSA
ncbi:uncharacterized protein LOC134622818 [Pelmatolapia mariae]|uniref:uncharacterized protein LOC134622818 n=1 Tax=Pelmatolapia mariae TaxID=158779 RepID=UPI002FE682CB